MNHSELLNYVAQNSGVKKKDAAKTLALVAGVVSETLSNGGAVSVAGLGVFSVQRFPARWAMNPITRDRIRVPAKKKPAFKPSGSLKNSVLES